MAWPLSQDYNEAIQSPESCFNDPELRKGEVVTNAIGLPMPRSGNFADVYEFKCSSRKWAIKCFTREVPGLRDRYAAISAYLKQAKLPFMVDFEYLDPGIKVRGLWYPVLKMHWVEGLTLNEFVNKNANQPATLEMLCQLWVRLARKLREANIGHCDLQHGNVLLVPGRTPGSLAVKLIDYDGMWVPALAQKRSGELGHPNYQHPQRLRGGTYNIEVDRFPHLVIYTALRSLIVGSRYLWNTFDNGDNLLFRQQDLNDPDKSALFRKLGEMQDVQPLVGSLTTAIKTPITQTPLLDEVVEQKVDVPVQADNHRKLVASVFRTEPTTNYVRSFVIAVSFVFMLLALVVGGFLFLNKNKQDKSVAAIADASTKSEHLAETKAKLPETKATSPETRRVEPPVVVKSPEPRPVEPPVIVKPSEVVGPPKPPEFVGPPAPPAVNVPSLIRQLEDSDAQIRIKAILALEEFGAEAHSALSALLAALKDKNQTVRRYAASALFKVGNPTPDDVPALSQALRETNPQSRTLAATLLAQLGSDARAAREVLQEALKVPEATVRQQAAQILGEIGPEAEPALPNLCLLLKDGNADVRRSAMLAMLKISPQGKGAEGAFLIAVQDPSPQVRLQAVRVVGNLGQEFQSEVIPALNDALKDGDQTVQIAAADALAKKGRDAAPAVSNLIACLSQTDTSLVQSALAALEAIGPAGKSAVPNLLRLLKEKTVNRQALTALGSIGADSREAVVAIVDFLRDDGLWENAQSALVKIGKPAASPIGKLLYKPENRFRFRAIRTLKALGPDASNMIPALKVIAQRDTEIELRREANQAINAINRIK